MKLSDIKIGMKYTDIRNRIVKTENLVIGALPNFCGSDYEIAENLKTKEKLYILYASYRKNIELRSSYLRTFRLF